MKHSRIALLLFLLIAQACTRVGQPLPAAGSTYVKAIYSLPRTLDPVLMNDTASLLVSNLIYDGLLRFTPDLRFEGAIAESWTVDTSGKRYTFILRKDARFHDSSPITSETVVRSLTRALAPGSTVYKYYDCIEGAEAVFSGKAKAATGLKAIATDKVVIELKTPFPPFLSILAGATAKILPLSAATDEKFFVHPVGSGPFRLVETKPSSGDYGEILLEQFEGYAGTHAKVKKLILRAVSETDAQAMAARGEVHDLASFPLAGTEEIFRSGKDASAPVAATWIIGLNTRFPPFNDIRIRQAFKAAVDSEAFRKEFYPDANPAVGYIPRGLPGHLAEDPKPHASTKPATKKPIVVAFPEVLAREKEMRVFLEKSLQAQGWNVSFVPMSWEKLMEGYDKKTLPAFLVAMNMDYPDTEFLIRNFESGNPDNFSGISNQKLDALIREARSTQDRIGRSILYQTIARRLEDLAVTINLFYPRSHNWISPCVKNFVPNILADYYIDYRTVEVDPSCVPNKGGRT